MVSGHYYLKVGYDSGTGQKVLNDKESVSEWFRTGPARNQAVGRQIAELTQEFIPGTPCQRSLRGLDKGSGIDLRVQVPSNLQWSFFFSGLDTSKFEVDTCVWLETPTERPYLGRLDENFYIVSGDNGFAAKSSDELGRLGATLAAHDGKWPSGYIAEDMVRVSFRTTPSKL